MNNSSRSKRYFFSVLITTVLGNIINAQNSSNSSGGVARGIGGLASYSIGQILNSSHKSTSATLNQGVQQPFEIKPVVTNELFKNISISISPNPTDDYLILLLEGTVDYYLNWQLCREGGELANGGKFAELYTSVKMHILPIGVYFLKVQSSNVDMKSFKVIKN